MTKYFHIIGKEECVDLLNKNEEEITFLKSTNMRMEVYIERLEKIRSCIKYDRL